MKGPSSPLDRTWHWQPCSSLYDTAMSLSVKLLSQSHRAVIASLTTADCHAKKFQSKREIPASQPLSHTEPPSPASKRATPPAPNKSGPCKAPLVGEELPTYLCHRKNKGVQALLVLLSHCTKTLRVKKFPIHVHADSYPSPHSTPPMGMPQTPTNAASAEQCLLMQKRRVTCLVEGVHT